MNSDLNKKLHELQKLLPKMAWIESSTCFFDDCTETCIGSHSISESKVLSLLEFQTENNGIAIYHLEDVPQVDFGEDKTLSTFHKAKRKLFIKGKDKTSIFYGFCKACDATTFQRLDNEDYTNQTEINFLHSLRTLAHNITLERNTYLLFKNKVFPTIENGNDEVEELQPKLDLVLGVIQQLPDDHLIHWDKAEQILPIVNILSSIPIKEQRDRIGGQLKSAMEPFTLKENYPMQARSFKNELTNSIKQFAKISGELKSTEINEIERLFDIQIGKCNERIRQLTASFRNNNFDQLNYLCIPINGVYLVAGAFVFYSKNGTTISVTFFPEMNANRTYFIFSEEDPLRKSKYLSELNVMPIEEFQKEISNIILSYGNNVFLSPQYYERLPQKVKELLVTDKAEIRKTGFNLFSPEFLITN